MKICPACKRSYPDDAAFCMLDGRKLNSPSTTSDPLVTAVINDRYTLKRRLGRGGAGTVYSARDGRLERDVAVKVLNRTKDGTSDRVRQRFEFEMRAVAAVDHPHVVKVFDFGHDAAIGPYLVMALLEGQSLARRLRLGPPLSMLEMLAIAQEICSALTAVHEGGIIHRDVKPSNLFLQLAPERALQFSVQLLDFGIAKVFSLPKVEHLRDVEVTTTGSFVGSASVVAPEQILGTPLTPACDIYSLGVVFYRMLTGTYPFRGDAQQVYRMHLSVPPERPSTRPGAHWLPPEIDRLLMKMLAKAPGSRPQSTREVVYALRDVRQPLLSAWADHFLGGTESDASLSTRPDFLHTTFTQADTDTDTPRALKPPILIIDDEEAIVDLMRLVLEDAGYNVVVALNGEEALEHLRNRERPEAMVMDLMMPGMDGISTIEACRRNGYDGLVVLCSTIRSPNVRARAEALENVTFVDKGPKLHQLPSVLSAFGVLP